MAESTLVGRDDELSRTTELVRRAAAGHGGTLLLSGPAGIGKTAVLDHTRAVASSLGITALVARGVRQGGEGGFATLHELLHPVLDAAQSLPAVQATALRVALGTDVGPAPDRLALGGAVLALLQVVAGRAGLLVVVDDLHWCDASSVETISFLARKAAGTNFALVAAARDLDDVQGLAAGAGTIVHLQPLGPAGSEELVARAGDLPPVVRQRVLNQSAGNPLALIELAARARNAHGDAVRASLPAARRVEQAFMSDVRRLPVGAQRALLVAAVGEGDPVSEVQRAAQALGVTSADLTVVHQAGLLNLAAGLPQVRFRHPLLASAVLGAAGPLGAADPHQALAAVAADPTRRALHRADAASGWDEDVAEELDAAVAAALRQGARKEAARLAERAAALTRDPGRRARRLADAASAARQAGAPGEAVRLVDAARGLDLDLATAKRLAYVDWLLALTAGVAGRDVRALMSLAEQLPAGDDRTEVLVWSATSCFVLQSSAAVRSRLEAELHQAPDSPSRTLGLALIGADTATSSLRTALSALRERDDDGTTVMLDALAFVAEERVDLATALDSWNAAVDTSARSGLSGDRATAMAGRATTRLVAGDLDGAADDAELSLRIADELGLDLVAANAAAGGACAAAWRGDDDRAELLIRLSADRSAAAPLDRVTATRVWASAMRAANAHRYGDALDALLQTQLHPPVALWAGAWLADVAVRAGRPEAARPWLDSARQVAQETGSAALSMLALRCSAMVEDDDAEAGFAAALAVGLQCSNAPELARTRLYFGEWLRRRRRIAEAREQVGLARAAFARLGLRPWIERADIELRATGVAVPSETRADDPLRSRLTPQELRVATLASQGLSNREIAERLSLSPPTVKVHLQRAFAKLGVQRRTQLEMVLSPPSG